MKLYCPQCYNKIEYKFSKPKFCTECGASTSNTSEVKADVNEKNEDKLKIEILERKIKELSMQNLKKNSNKVSKNISANADTDDENGTYEYDDYEEDYEETQRHINNFKNKNRKSGITVEYINNDNSVSFGSLMESAASGKSNNVEEFKMTDDKTSKKSPEKILEELRIESASAAKVIEIE